MSWEKYVSSIFTENTYTIIISISERGGDCFNLTSPFCLAKFRGTALVVSSAGGYDVLHIATVPPVADSGKPPPVFRLPAASSVVWVPRWRKLFTYHAPSETFCNTCLCGKGDTFTQIFYRFIWIPLYGYYRDQFTTEPDEGARLPSQILYFRSVLRRDFYSLKRAWLVGPPFSPPGWLFSQNTNVIITMGEFFS